MATSSGGVVSSGSTQTYNGGTTLVGYTVYGTVQLNSATASGGLITSGGVEYAGEGGIGVVSGLSIDDTVNSGGTIRAENYGSASATQVGNGGTLLVDNGGSATSASISAGGVLSVFNGYGTAGTVYETTVLSGGAEILSGGGANGVNDVIQSGGSGYASAGAGETVSSGTGSGFTALSGGTIIISSGGVGYSEVASSGGYIGVAGGVASNTVLFSGAWMDIASAGGPSVASGTILSGGTEYMYPQGSSVSGIVLSGGREFVGQAGGYPRSGTSINDTVSSGGTIFVENGGTATGTVANNAGLINIDNGGRAISGIISSGGIISAYSNYNSGGTVSAFSVLSSGTAIIGNGGSGIANSASNGGTIVISSGGRGYNDQATPGGSLLVSNGGFEFASAGTATNATALSGGMVQVFSGGVASNSIISSGGELRNGKYGAQGSAVVGTDIGTVFSSGASGLYYNRAVSISAQVLNGAFVDFGYGQDGDPSNTNLSVLSAATISSGGTVQMRKATVASGVTVAGGAFNLIESGARASGTTVRNGGVETLSGNTVETGGVISSGGTVVINASSSLSSETLLDRGSIDFNYLGGSIVSATVTSAGLMTVTADNGSQTSVQLAGAYPQTENTFLLNGDTATLVCFLDGTAIATPDGTKAVEDLAIGDEVLTHDWHSGRDVPEKLVWVGHQQATVRPHLPDDEAGWPVRIRQNAIADGIPARDLVVTAEHCLFFDGAFIPARMLVNGTSIAYDRSRARFTVFHVETARHAVLYAENMQTESYLDTGNRRNFAQPGRVAVLDRTTSTWEHDAAAPLAVSRETVEPVYRRIAARVGAVAQGSTTTEHGLVIRTAQGIIRPTRSRNGHVVFHLPGGLSEVELLSRADRPFDAVGPFVDDRRTLGVLIGAVTLFESDAAHRIATHLEAASLSGWHAPEAGAYRWTDGRAVLPLRTHEAAPLAIVPAGVVLAIEVIAAGPYRREQPAPEAEIMAENALMTSLRA